jgi:hypothetical protein
MKALLAICLLALSLGVKAQDVLPPAPDVKQQPITNVQLSKNLTTQAWGIMAGSAVFGALMIADRTGSDMNYGGYALLSTGMAMGLTWHFRAKEARMKHDMRTADLHQ